MSVIEKIMSHQSIIDKPPVLLDIGASGAIHYKWKDIAKYSVCIAFDPDDRDIDNIQGSQSFKKVHFIDSLVSARLVNEEMFYLTKSPHCSSMLKPIQKEVDKYSFGHLFDVEKIGNAKSTTLNEIFQRVCIEKVDWIKIDSQGIDLRIFKSCPAWEKIITVEFEPGIIDAYENEDKFSDILSFMDESNFWMSECIVNGDVRISKDVKSKYFPEFEEMSLSPVFKTNPGWVGATYMNSFACMEEIRDYLLGILFNYVEKNIPYSIELCEKAIELFEDDIFKSIMDLLLAEKNQLIKLGNRTKIDPFQFKSNILEVYKTLNILKESREKFIVFGAGIGAEFIVNYLSDSIEFLVDQDSTKIGALMCGKKIHSVDFLEKSNSKIIISVFGFERQIKDFLIEAYRIDVDNIIELM